MPAAKSADRGEKLNRRIVLLTKMAKLVKILKAAKFMKVALTLGTMGLSIFAYSFALGLWFSVGFVVMILIHEMGHVFALRTKGLKASAPVFIPFLGAAIFAPKLGDRHEEAYVGYGGPLVGGAVAIGLMIATVATHNPSETLKLVAYTALFVNVFNLIPIRPLDGGRVTQAVGPWFMYLGVLILVGATLLMKSPAFLIVWILALDDIRIPLRMRVVLGWVIQAAMIWMEFWHVGQYQPLWINIIDVVVATMFNLMRTASMMNGEDLLATKDDRPHLSTRQRLVWFGLYVGIAVVLIASMVWSSGYLPPRATH